MMFDFTGRVALITGAGGGIGSEAARAYTEQGAAVALFDVRKEAVEAVANELTAKGKQAIAIQCDSGSEEQIKNSVQKVIDHYGKIDILLNNASLGGGGKVETQTQEFWDNIMAINVRGHMFMCKYVVPHMIERHYGRIINVASVNAVFGEKNDDLARVPYCTSKSAVLGLTNALGTYLPKHGILCNAVCPGVTDTDQPRASLLKYPGFEEWYANHNPVSRIAQPREMCSTFLWLSAEETTYVSAQAIQVDCGFTKA